MTGDALRRAAVAPETLAWGVPGRREARWHALLAVLAALALYLLLPDRVLFTPRWLLPALEVTLIVVLSVTNPVHLTAESRDVRVLSMTLIALASAANGGALVLLVQHLLHSQLHSSGRVLIEAGMNIWLTNALIFALWFWELDRGGPLARLQPQHRQPDFLFVPMTTPGAARDDWAPAFVDYVYLSFTNAMAFSPTDTMPLTVAAKALMLVEALASLLTIALVAARAVNILS